MKHNECSKGADSDGRQLVMARCVDLLTRIFAPTFFISYAAQWTLDFQPQEM
jgi:hypothetical protein